MATIKRVHSDNAWDILLTAYQAAPSVLPGIAQSPWYWVDVFRKSLHAGDEKGVMIALRVMKEGGSLDTAAFDAIKAAVRFYDLEVTDEE